MPVTAKDIARELGLSQSTVSRILNGDCRQRIAAETRQRVLEAAKRLEYQPNALARSLRRGRTHLIGLYTHHTYDARNDFLAEILGGLQQACSQHGLDLLLPIGFQDRPVEDVYNALRDGRIDGLVLHHKPDDPLVLKLSSSDLPVVAVADPHPTLPSVTCDDADGMRLLIAYLWERGYRRFAFLAPDFALASVERRRQTWEQQLRARGVPTDDLLMLHIPAEDAEGALDSLPAAGGAPRAICCWNDRTAYSLLRACRDRNVAVPQTLAVTGFDGFLDLKLPARQLVTVRCPWAEVAARAVGLLVQHIAGDRLAPETCLPVALSPGDTA